MSDVERPFGPMDPNSEHQLWSRWIYGVEASWDQLPSVAECIGNAQRYFSKRFGTVGRVRCDQQGNYYCFIVEIEGPPAHDPEYVHTEKVHFVKHFMRQGFGSGALLTRFSTGVLAGDTQDGQPPAQMLVMPTPASTTKLYIS